MALSGRPARSLPRQELLREMTDRAVLDEVLRRGRVTRAEVARDTGITKPTISASIRRMEAAGLLLATGRRTGHRGRVATYYELQLVRAGCWLWTSTRTACTPDRQT